MRINNHLTSLISINTGARNLQPKIVPSHAKNTDWESSFSANFPQNANYPDNVTSLQKTKATHSENSKTITEQTKNIILAHPSLAVKAQANLLNSNVYQLLK